MTLPLKLQRLALAVAFLCPSCGEKTENPRPSAPEDAAEPSQPLPPSPPAAPEAPDPAAMTFRMTHAFALLVPEGARQIHAWLAMPQREDPDQTVENFAVQSAYPNKIVKDARGNEFVFVEILDPKHPEIRLSESFTVTRKEIRSGAQPDRTRPLTPEEREAFAADLAPSTHVVIDDHITALAAEITAGEKNPVRAARRIYDWVLENIDYWVKDPANKKASAEGSTEYCLTARSGDSTDFHSLWTSLARAAGIPTRLVYGSLAKPALDGQPQDQSYHCWPEFYAPEIGWVPHDVALADLYHDSFPVSDNNRSQVDLTTATGYHGPDPSMVEYYFGNLDARRVVWHRGRDLRMVNPSQAGPPINALPTAYVEIDGQPFNEPGSWTRTLSYVATEP